MKINFVICTHNNEKIIGKCIESVLRQEIKKEWKIAISIMDDASTDKTVEIAKSYMPRVTDIIGVGSPQGPSILRNRAILPTDYHFFMDSDVILDKNCLMELVKCKADVCGPKLLLPDGRINSAGGMMTRSGIGYDCGSGDEDDETYSIPVPVFYICSAAMLVKTEVIDKIGDFDRTYFYGNEDTDFGWRANLAGYHVLYWPDAKATHLKSQTVSKDMGMVYFNSTKNRMRTMLKNYNFFNLHLWGAVYLGLSLADILFRPYRMQKIAAWFWLLKNLNNTIWERKAIQKLRKRRDSELPFTGWLKLR